MSSRLSKLKKCALVVALLVFAYVTSYFVLSRWSLSITNQDDLQCFFYIPTDAYSMGESDTLAFIHHVLAVVYYPVWSFDHYICGGPYPCGIPLIRLDFAD